MLSRCCCGTAPTPQLPCRLMANVILQFLHSVQLTDAMTAMVSRSEAWFTGYRGSSLLGRSRSPQGGDRAPVGRMVKTSSKQVLLDAGGPVDQVGPKKAFSWACKLEFRNPGAFQWDGAPLGCAVRPRGAPHGMLWSDWIRLSFACGGYVLIIQAVEDCAALLVRKALAWALDDAGLTHDMARGHGSSKPTRTKTLFSVCVECECWNGVMEHGDIMWCSCQELVLRRAKGTLARESSCSCRRRNHASIGSFSLAVPASRARLCPLMRPRKENAEASGDHRPDRSWSCSRLCGAAMLSSAAGLRVLSARECFEFSLRPSSYWAGYCNFTTLRVSCAASKGLFLFFQHSAAKQWKRISPCRQSIYLVADLKSYVTPWFAEHPAEGQHVESFGHFRASASPEDFELRSCSIQWGSLLRKVWCRVLAWMYSLMFRSVVSRTRKLPLLPWSAHLQDFSACGAPHVQERASGLLPWLPKPVASIIFMPCRC